MALDPAVLAQLAQLKVGPDTVAAVLGRFQASVRQRVGQRTP